MEVKVCRICLVQDVKLYDICAHKLKTCYELLTNHVVGNDGLPRWLCWECGARLLSCGRFRDKALRSRALLHPHGRSTSARDPRGSEDISGKLQSIDREEHNLVSSLSKHTFYVSITRERDSDSDEGETAACGDSEVEAKCEPLDPDMLGVTFGQSPEPEKPASASIKTRKRKVQTTDKLVAEKIAKITPVEKQQQAPDKTLVNTQRKGDANSETTIQPIFNTPNDPFNKTNEEHLPTEIGFTCDKCKENFESKTDIEKHIHSHFWGINKTDDSTSNTKTKCGKFNISFDTNADLVKHLYTHMGKNEKSKNEKPTDKYTCQFCNTKFGTNMCLIEHMERQHNVKWLTCDECDYRTIVESCLVQHQKTHAGETGIRKQAHTGIVFKCGSCNYTSSNKSHLIEHKRTHTKEKAFKCDICEFKTIQSSILKQHLLIEHVGVKPFKCSYCSYTCSGKVHLVSHERTHTGEKPFKCSYCNYSCSQKNVLVKHERTHTGEKPFKCSYCSYASSNKGHLVRHERTHTGEKPYKCDICEYKAARSSSLKEHLMSEHAGVKPFKCSNCSYACSQKNDLVKHERTHTGEKPFKCSYCSYACSQKNDLVKHERTHTGEKPFKCSYCSYACSEKSSLVKHERTHTGEKPYKCDICEYKAAESTKLKRHLMLKHANVIP